MKILFSLEQYTKIFPRLKRKRKLLESSQFGKKLIESRKIRTFYGKPSQKYLQTLYKKNNYPSQLSFSFFRLLESRLDVVLYRAHFFESIALAKQQIRIGKIEVNDKKVASPGYTVLPGDVIRVLPQQKEVAQTEPYGKIINTSTVVSLKDNTKSLPPIKNLRKEGGWRFQRSPFLLSIFVKHFKEIQDFIRSDSQRFATITSNTISKSSALKNQIAESKRKAIINPLISRLSKLSFKEFSKANLLKTWCFQNSFLFNFLSCLRKDNMKNTVKQTFMKASLQRKQQSESPSLSRSFLLEKKNDPIKKESLKKETNSFKDNFSPASLLITNQNDKSPLPLPLPSAKAKAKNNFIENARLLDNSKKSVEICSWLFLNFVLFLKKQTVSTKKKSNCFFSQKNQSFFKQQSFFKAKKNKPLHLEISYRSRSIIFLFPPQRVCFPSFIDLAQIYK